MDYDDNDFQNQNLHLAGEGNNKFPPVLQPHALPKFDFDDTLNTHLRFDSLVETEGFLGIEGNEDNNWIEEFSRGSSGIVFSSVASESCAISRHHNVWSEATSSESVEMLLNSVGQDEDIVRENTKISDTSDELGCIMEQMEPDQMNHEKSLFIEETVNIEPKPSVDVTLGESSVIEADAGHEQALVEDDSPTIAEVFSMEGNNAVLASNSATLEAVDTTGHDKRGEEENTPVLASNAATVEAVDTPGHDKIGEEENNPVLASIAATVQAVDSPGHDKIGEEENNPVLASNAATVEAVDTPGHDKIREEENNPVLASNAATVEAVDTPGHDKIEEEENNAVLASNPATVETVDTPGHDKIEEEENNAVLASNPATVETVDTPGHDKREEVENNAVLTSNPATIENVDTPGHDKREEDENNAVMASNPVTVEAVDTARHEKVGEEENNAILASNPAIVEAVDIGHDKIGEAVDTSNPMDSMVESAKDGVSEKIENNEDGAGISNLKPSVELAVIATDGDQISKSSEILSESIVSETVEDQDRESSQIPSESIVSKTVGYVAEGSSSKLAESKSLSDASPTDMSGTVIDGKDSEALPLNPEGLQQLSQDETPDIILTSSMDLHMAKRSSDASEQGSFSETEKVLSGEPESEQSTQTVPPLDASSSGTQMDQQATENTQQGTQFAEGSPASEGSKDSVDGQTVPPPDAIISGAETEQQARKHTDNIQRSTQFVEGCPASEGSKDAVDTDAARQVLMKQPEETFKENLVTKVVNVAETQAIQDMNDVNESPNISSLANRGSETGNDGREEDKTAASVGITIAGSPASHPKGDATEIGVSSASCLESSVKSNEIETENAGTNLRDPLLSFPTVKSSEPQVDKTETNIVKKPEDQKISTSKSVESLDVNKNENFGNGMNITSDLQKTGEISKTVNYPQATLVSPIVVVSPSTSNLEKAAVKSSKTKSERKPRRTSKSAGKDTSRKGNNVKGAIHFQHFQSRGKTNAVDQSSAGSVQLTQSTEKQQNPQTTALKATGTFSTPTASLPDLNSSSLSNILRRPFTDLQQVQLRAQIFVYGALIQGTAPDEAYMISAFGGPDGGKDSWEKAWRACVIRAQKLHVANPETPLQSRAGKIETPTSGHTSRKESSASNPIIPLSSPLWNLSTPVDTLQSSSVQRGLAAGHQPLGSLSHAHQTPPITNIIGHNTPWMSPLPYRNPWHAVPQTSGFDVGSRFPVFPVTEPVKLTPMKESSLLYPGSKNVQSGTSSNVFMGPPVLEPASAVVSPAQHSTGTKSRKRKKIPDTTVEAAPSILNSLKHTEFAVAPFASVSTYVPNTTAPATVASEPGTPGVVSITAVPTNLLFTSSGKKMKSSFPSPIFGGNLVPDVTQRSVLSEDAIDKLKEAKKHAEDASALAVTAVSHSEYIWKQIEQQSHAGLQEETQGRLASAAVAISAAAAVAKAAAAAANLAANAALQAKLMAEEASLQSVSDQGNEFPKSFLKSESPMVGSNSVLIAAREAAKKRVEAATAASKRAENMDSIVKAAELASEAVSQAGILVSMGHPPLLSKLVEAGPSNYWRQAQEPQEVQPNNTGELEKETVTTSYVSPRTVQTELHTGKTAVGVYAPVSTSKEKTKGQIGQQDSDMVKNHPLVDPQTESEQITKSTNEKDIKEGSNVEVFKEEPGLRTGWYSATVLSLENDKAYVLFSDLSSEQGTEKLKEWIALKGENDEAPKIRIARSGTAMPYEGTRKRRRAAIGDPVWKIGDRVDSWVHDSWLEGVITEKNKKDENTLTVHFPAQGDTLTIKAWNLRPSLTWKDGKWTECCSSGENFSSSHVGDTPKEKRPRLGTPTLEAEGKDLSLKIVDDPDIGKQPQAVIDFSVSETTFNIGRSTIDDDKPNPLRMKRTGLQKQGSRVVFGVPKPGKKRKFMDVSKHYVSEASTKTRERKEPARPLKPPVPQSSGAGSWRMPSKNISREKQSTIPKPKTFKPVPKVKEKLSVPARTLPRKEVRNTTASDTETDDATDQSGENKGPASGTVEEQTTTSTSQDASKNSSSSNTNKGKGAPAVGRLAKIEEDKALAEKSSKASDGMEPRRSVRRIQPTSRLLEGLQTSMMTSKIPSVSSHSKSHQSQSKK